MELCIDFGGTEIKLAVIDGSQVVASGSIPVLGSAVDLAAAAVEARRLLAETTGTADAVGIAVPGVVDPTSGRMLHANAKYDFLEGLDLNGWALTEFDLPAVVENDARAALIGETSTGSAAGERDAVLVTLGTGIGTAAMIDGTPLRGRTGHAGILGGHLTVDLDGPVCPCGNVGCGEALASTWALGHLDSLERFASRRPAQSERQRVEVSLNERNALAERNTLEDRADPADRERPALTMAEVFTADAHTGIRDRFLHVWGAVVTSLVHSYDPAVVILSGGILRAGDAVRVPIEAHVRDHLWPSMTSPRFIVPPEPELSVARGLSVLARAATRQTLSHPLPRDPAPYGGAQRAGSDTKGRVDPAHTDPARTDAAHTDPAHTDPAHVDPAETATHATHPAQEEQ